MLIYRVIFLLAVTLQAHDEDYTFTCDPGLVIANVSSNLTLSCQVKPPVDLTEKFVKWSVNGTSNNVFIWRSGMEDRADQLESFKNRAQIHKEKLKTGNITLTISDITPEDEGNYSVLVNIGSIKVKSTVTLVVRSKDSEKREGEAPTTKQDPSTPAMTYVIVVTVIAVTVIVVTTVIVIILRWKGYLCQCDKEGNADEQIQMTNIRANNTTGPGSANEETPPLKQSERRKRRNQPRNNN